MASYPKTLVELLREKYPAPTTVLNAPSDDYGHKLGYCVGGAFLEHCRYELSLNGFPVIEAIAIGLRRANRSLDVETSESFARQIANHNDRREYEQAWSWLERALEWRRDNTA